MNKVLRLNPMEQPPINFVKSEDCDVFGSISCARAVEGYLGLINHWAQRGWSNQYITIHEAAGGRTCLIGLRGVAGGSPATGRCVGSKKGTIASNSAESRRVRKRIEEATNLFG